MSLFDEDDVIPLISFDGNTYSVNHDTVAFLRTIPTPIATVSIAGRYRTGKSTLLNALADTDGAPFSVGDTTNACTKGIRIRKTPLHTSSTLTVFLIDTEGIGSLNADSDHDTKILAMALLLSSSFLYNSVGAIDEAALSSLGLMTRVSEFIRVDADNEASESDLSAYFPQFYWCLRDFSLRLESTRGEKCSEQEYLEAALSDAAEGNDERNIERNRVRRSLREYFPNRSLVTLPRPAEHTQRMSRRTMNNVFTNSVKELRKRIIGEIHPLHAGDHAMTGSMFAEVCAYYTQALNKPGAVPTIRDSWSMLVEIQARDTVAAVLKEAYAEMRARIGSGTNPSQLKDDLEGVVVRSLAEFNRRVMQADASRADELVSELREQAGRHVAECQVIFDKKVEESMCVLETAANREDAKLGEIASLVSQALRQLESDLDPHGLDRWRAKCLENLVQVWIPRLLHTYENEKELSMLESAELKSRCQEAERVVEETRMTLTRETERARRDAELQIESSMVAMQMQLEAKDSDLRDERERVEDLEQVLTALRIEHATVSARACAEREVVDSRNTGDEESQLGDEDNASNADSVESTTARSVTDRQRVISLETELRSLGDEVRELRNVRDSMNIRCTKEREDREKVELVFQQRLQALQAKHVESVQKLRHEHDEALRKARDEASIAAQKEGECRRELLSVQQSLSRAEVTKQDGEVMRQRELRVCQEGQLTMRAMCEDLQVRMVDMQRLSLADNREREQTHRDKLSTMASEHLQAQLERGEALRREERAMGEIKDLKRKLSAHDDIQKDIKRAREAGDEYRVRSEQVVTENEKLRVRLEEAVAERERLRMSHIHAESERAALKRELEIVRVEQNVV